ncbi:MAG: OmpA family protein [Oleiphilaceae bacterium]|nr:OmpA family protein [Oleiphilaceae bacterium]
MQVVFKMFVASLAFAIITGCATRDAYTGEEKTSNATLGSVIGAVSGAVIGAVTSSKGDRKKGILIGATAGALAGGGAGYYMDQQEEQLRTKLERSGVRVQRNGNEITLIMPGKITFDVSKSSVRQNFSEVLDSIALVLKEFDKTAIEITGHTDSTGSASFNQTLSEQRADSVKAQLIARQISSGRVHSKGLGFRAPIATNDTVQGRQENRRVELKLLPI